MIDSSALVEGFYPDPPPANPQARRAEEAVVTWLWRIGFLTTPEQEAHLRSFEFGTYHGLATPEAGLDALVLGLKWFCWGSLADDQYDNYDWGEREHRLARVIDDVRAVVAGRPVSVSNPVLAGFVEYWPDLTKGLAVASLRRITGHLVDYLQAILLQNRYHARGEVPDAATFLMLRRNTIAMVFQADVLEIIGERRVPEPLWESLPFRELVWCFADVTAWHNDVYGLEKDLADGQTCNAVRVVAAGEECDLDTAVARVLERARHRQRLMLELERGLPELTRRLGLPASAAARATRLAEDLRAYVHANLVWIGQTARYDLDRPRIRGTFDDLLTR